MLNPHRFKPAVLTITMITLIQELPFAVKFYPFRQTEKQSVLPCPKTGSFNPKLTLPETSRE